MGKQTMRFPNRSDTNQAVQAKKMARLEVGNFGFKTKRNSTIRLANKGSDQLRSYCES